MFEYTNRTTAAPPLCLSQRPVPRKPASHPLRLHWYQFTYHGGEEGFDGRGENRTINHVHVSGASYHCPTRSYPILTLMQFAVFLCTKTLIKWPFVKGRAMCEIFLSIKCLELSKNKFFLALPASSKWDFRSEFLSRFFFTFLSSIFSLICILAY